MPESKKTAINPKNNDDECSQCAVTVALNHKQIKNHSQRT